jgi:hypothetical protein
MLAHVSQRDWIFGDDSHRPFLQTPTRAASRKRRRSPIISPPHSATSSPGAGMSRRHRRAAVRMYRRLAEVTFDPIAGLDGMDHEANLERVTSTAERKLRLRPA